MQSAKQVETAATPSQAWPTPLDTGTQTAGKPRLDPAGQGHTGKWTSGDDRPGLPPGCGGTGEAKELESQHTPPTC